MKTYKYKAKSILTATKLPFADFVINPYIGCSFGCHYCYASFMARLVGETIQNWGKYVYVKTNACFLLSRDIKKLYDKKYTILFSSVTDPYQTAEKYEQLTRRLLLYLLEHNFPGKISILTKSPLVLRDTDIFKDFNSIEIGITITDINNKLGSFFENKAPTNKSRLYTIEHLITKGFNTYAFIGPLFPNFYQTPYNLDNLFKQLFNIGIRSVFVEHINMNKYILNSLNKKLKTEYSEKQINQQILSLNAYIKQTINNYGINLIGKEIIQHKKL